MLGFPEVSLAPDPSFYPSHGRSPPFPPCSAQRHGPRHRRAHKAPCRSRGTVCRCSATSNIRLASGTLITSIRRRRKVEEYACGAGHFRQLQPSNSRNQGLVRCGCRHDLRHVDGASARRSVGLLRADSGSGQLSGGLCAHLLSPCATPPATTTASRLRSRT